MPDDQPTRPILTPDTWREISRIVDATLELPREQRAQFLRSACPNAPLRVEVERLVDSCEQSEAFMDRPASEVAAPLFPSRAVGDYEDISLELRKALEGRFEVERELGRGATSVVYLARDVRYGRSVAIKVLRAELAAALGSGRFLREIEILARLTHPHIVPLLESGAIEGRPYYIMPHIEGESLRARLLREQQLPLEESLRIARAVAGALGYAHRQNVLHRDLKPENILFADGHAVVADFGIARAIAQASANEQGEATSDTLTATGLSLGTPAYMSPEQASGDRTIDERSDVYALGCLLYEMLAGRPPFTGPTAESVIRQHLLTQPTDLGVLRDDLPLDIVRGVMRALAKSRVERFGSMEDFGRALASQVVTETTRSSSNDSLGLPTNAKRKRIAYTLSLAAVVLLTGVLAWPSLSGRNTETSAGSEYPRSAIAVLPFRNMTPAGAHEYFASGLHDELLTQLSKIRGLSVRGRNSVSGYTHTQKTTGEIAEELEVGALLEGSVQVLGDRLRVSVLLIDASTDEHLWAEGYDRTLDDAFEIQSEVARRVALAVGGSIAAPALGFLSDPPTANAEAYRLYLQGREYGTRQNFDRRGLEIAIQLYGRAVALDSQFALAYAALSEAHGRLAWYRYDPSPSRLAAQRATAERAVALAPMLAQTRSALGNWHYWGRSDFEEALREFERALQDAPHDAQLWFSVANVNRRLGRWGNFERAMLRSLELDPRNTHVIRNLGLGYEFMRRYEDALNTFDRALRVAPEVHLGAVMKGLAYVRGRGELDTLRAVLERVPQDADLGPARSTAISRARLMLLERAPDSLLALLRSSPTSLFITQDWFHPTSLYAGWAHQLRGDSVAARRAFDSALITLDSAIRDLPEDWRIHAARGLALGGLGRHEHALEEARWLESSAIYRLDKFDGSWVAEERAAILAAIGESDAALDEIERQLSGPSILTIHLLRLDPRWDKLRTHPRFHRILTMYA